jgi:hypothetical protein
VVWDEDEIVDEDSETEQDLGPGDSDYDLSEAHGYTWEPARADGPVPQWLLTVIAIVAALALVVPGIIFFLQHA